MTRKYKPTTTLERIVWRDAQQHDDPINYLSDVTQYGCSSGIVGRLVYYVDTLKFYRTHKAAISKRLKQDKQDYGLQLDQLRGYDDDDPLCQDTTNQNLLAWYIYEQTANDILQQLEN